LEDRSALCQMKGGTVFQPISPFAGRRMSKNVTSELGRRLVLETQVGIPRRSEPFSAIPFCAEGVGLEPTSLAGNGFQVMGTTSWLFPPEPDYSCL
jgi:hypothetical protein